MEKSSFPQLLRLFDVSVILPVNGTKYSTVCGRPIRKVMMLPDSAVRIAKAIILCINYFPLLVLLVSLQTGQTEPLAASS